MMYCQNCGAPLAGGSAYCSRCGAHINQQQTYYTPPYQSAPIVQEGNRMYGFGMALASTILSFIAYIFAFMSIIPPFIIVALGLGIPSLIFGIVSICRFRTCCRENRKKPIATLVLGINGLIWASLALFFAPLCAIAGSQLIYWL